MWRSKDGYRTLQAFFQEIKIVSRRDLTRWRVPFIVQSMDEGSGRPASLRSGRRGSVRVGDSGEAKLPGSAGCWFSPFAALYCRSLRDGRLSAVFDVA